MPYTSIDKRLERLLEQRDREMRGRERRVRRVERMREVKAIPNREPFVPYGYLPAPSTFDLLAVRIGEPGARVIGRFTKIRDAHHSMYDTPRGTIAIVCISGTAKSGFAPGGISNDTWREAVAIVETIYGGYITTPESK